MELAIIDEKGYVTVVTESIELFDLDKPFSRAAVTGDIQREIKRVQENEDA